MNESPLESNEEKKNDFSQKNSSLPQTDVLKEQEIERERLDGVKIEEQQGSEFEEQNEQQNEEENDVLEEIEESQKNLEKALEHKEKGNKYFQEQIIDDAIEHYELGLKYCPSGETKQLSVLNSNLAICYLKKKDYETVIEHATKSIKLDPTFKKPYLNRITAYEKTEKLEDALEDLKELQKLDPNDKQLMARIFVMTKDLEKLNEKRKSEVLSGLKSLGNTILGKFGMSLDNFKMEPNENGSYNIQYKK